MQSVFFFVALRWAPRPFGGARAKKNTTQGVFFLLRPRGKAGEGEAPLGAGTGPEQKKKHQPGFFFAAAPAKGKGRRSPVGSRHGARAKKKNTTQGVFFLLRPRGKAGEGEASLGAGWPRAGAQRVLLPLPFAGPAAKKKKTPGWCFFFSGPVPAPNGASPSRAFRRGRSKKKTYPGWCFFFAAAPRGRSLTHCGPGWRCLPLGGVVFFFCCGPARTGVVFFFCCGPARTLTHSRWAGAISARPGWCFFFAAAPPGLFRQ